MGEIPAIMDQANLLIEPSDPAAIVDAISTFTADAELREKLDAKARKRAVTVQDNRLYARQILELWQRASYA